MYVHTCICIYMCILLVKLCVVVGWDECNVCLCTCVSMCEWG